MSEECPSNCLRKNATFASLYLKKPNRYIDSNAQRSPRFLELVYGELGEGDPLAGTNFLVDAVDSC